MEITTKLCIHSHIVNGISTLVYVLHSVRS